MNPDDAALLPPTTTAAPAHRLVRRRWAPAGHGRRSVRTPAGVRRRRGGARRAGHHPRLTGGILAPRADVPSRRTGTACRRAARHRVPPRRRAHPRRVPEPACHGDTGGVGRRKHAPRASSGWRCRRGPPAPYPLASHRPLRAGLPGTTVAPGLRPPSADRRCLLHRRRVAHPRVLHAVWSRGQCRPWHLRRLQRYRLRAVAQHQLPRPSHDRWRLRCTTTGLAGGTRRGACVARLDSALLVGRGGRCGSRGQAVVRRGRGNRPTKIPRRTAAWPGGTTECTSCSRHRSRPPCVLAA